MKKFVSLLLVLVVIATLCVGAMSTSAETIDDIVKKFQDNSPIAHYIIGDVKNLAKSVTFTDAQLKEASKLVDDFLALGITDLGNTADKYPKSMRDAVIGLIDTFCKDTGFTYEIVQNPASKHIGDIIFRLYDPNKKVIFSFDGDVVSKTGLTETANTTLPLAVGGACVVLAGLFVALAAKTGKQKAGAAA